MKQVRVNITYHPNGTITAMLQEADYFTSSGCVHWRDVRPLSVTSDGRVTLFASEPTVKYEVVPVIREEIPQAFQDAFSEGELEL